MVFILMKSTLHCSSFVWLMKSTWINVKTTENTSFLYLLVCLFLAIFGVQLSVEFVCSVCLFHLFVVFDLFFACCCGVWFYDCFYVLLFLSSVCCFDLFFLNNFFLRIQSFGSNTLGWIIHLRIQPVGPKTLVWPLSCRQPGCGLWGGKRSVGREVLSICSAETQQSKVQCRNLPPEETQQSKVWTLKCKNSKNVNLMKSNFKMQTVQKCQKVCIYTM